MIAIVDYGVGNLFSLKSSLGIIGEDAVVTGDADEICACEKIILPGVGAFGDAAKKLADTGLDAVVKRQAGLGVPLLGICLGMQLLFERSYEYGQHAGLGLIPGSVRAIAPLIPKELKVPHIGWNRLDFPADRARSPLFARLKQGEFVYFVHSFAAMECEDWIIGTAEYGIDVTAAVQRDNVFGTQFHPEKSGDVGMRILAAFAEWKGESA